MTQGIYKISSPSGNFYIGSSQNIERRFVQHKSELRRSKHYNFLLQKAYEKHQGRLCYEIIFCVTCKNDIEKFEQYFIDELKPSYNLSNNASCPMRDPAVAARMSAASKSSEKHKKSRLANQKLAASSVSKRVVRMTDGFVFDSGYAAAKFYGANRKDSVGDAIRHEWMFAGHFWKFEGDSKTLQEVECRYFQREINRKENAKIKATSARSKKVRRLSDGKVFQSAVAAARELNAYRTAISDSIRLGVERIGSRWEYV